MINGVHGQIRFPLSVPELSSFFSAGPGYCFPAITKCIERVVVPSTATAHRSTVQGGPPRDLRGTRRDRVPLKDPIQCLVIR